MRTSSRAHGLESSATDAEDRSVGRRFTADDYPQIALDAGWSQKGFDNGGGEGDHPLTGSRIKQSQLRR